MRDYYINTLVFPGKSGHYLYNHLWLALYITEKGKLGYFLIVHNALAY